MIKNEIIFTIFYPKANKLRIHNILSTSFVLGIEVTKKLSYKI